MLGQVTSVLGSVGTRSGRPQGSGLGRGGNLVSGALSGVPCALLCLSFPSVETLQAGLVLWECLGYWGRC